MILHYRDHAANERTFLAWVRTVIAIIGFGLAAARLGAESASPISEIAMLAAGSIVLLLAFLRMRKVQRRITAGDELDDDPMPADALLLVLVASLFVLLGAFAMHVW